MSYPYYEDGILCRFIGTNYGVRTVEGKEGRAYAAGQAAPRQRIHRDDLELLAESFKPLHAAARELVVLDTEQAHSLQRETFTSLHAEVAVNAKAKRKPDTE